MVTLLPAGGSVLEESARQRRIEQLVEAALPEFARRGLHGARVDAIARAAAMNKRLLYHYVGNKEALFLAARDRAFARLLHAEDPSPEASDRRAEAWQLLCQAQAAGLGLAAETLAGLAGTSGPSRGQALATELARSLLPGLAGVLAEPAVPPQAAAKPRLKLRPVLRPGSGRG